MVFRLRYDYAYYVAHRLIALRISEDNVAAEKSGNVHTVIAIRRRGDDHAFQYHIIHSVTVGI